MNPFWTAFGVQWKCPALPLVALRGWCLSPNSAILPPAR